MSSNKRPTDHLQPSAKKRTQDRQGARDEEEEDSEVTFLHQSCCVWLRAGLRLPQFWALHCVEYSAIQAGGLAATAPTITLPQRECMT